MQTQSQSRVPWNKGKLVGQKAPLDPAADLVDSHAPGVRRQPAKSRSVQPGHRQQASRL